MEYTFEKDYRIKIIGKPDELRGFIKELSEVLDKGTGYKQIEDEVEHLEDIIDMHNYTFGVYNRIYYNNKEIIYTPNVSGEEARKFHFKIFKTFFEDTLKRMGEKQSKKNDVLKYNKRARNL